MKKRLAILLLAVLVAAGALAGTAWWLHDRDEASFLGLYGNVDLREVALAFEESERIASVLVEEGSRVTRGQVIAELETDRLLQEVSRAEGNARAREHALRRLLNGTRPQEIDRARAELEAAEVEARNAKRTFDRLEGLAGTGATTPQDIDDAQAALDSAEARRKVAREVLDLAVAGPREEDIAEARANLDTAKADLALLKRRLEDTSLASPVDGIVRARILEPGEMASPEKPVLTIALTTPKWIRAYVPETDLARVRPGMPAKVSVDSFPDRTYTGWVGFVSPTAEFTPKSVETPELRTSLVYEIRVFVEDPENELRLGMPATVRIDPAEGDGP